MRMTLLNQKSDIEWLFSTHLKAHKKLQKKTRAFLLYGNEDAPTKIVLFSTKNPRHDDNGFFAWIDGVKRNPRYSRHVVGALKSLRATGRKTTARYPKRTKIRRIAASRRRSAAPSYFVRQGIHMSKVGLSRVVRRSERDSMKQFKRAEAAHYRKNPGREEHVQKGMLCLQEKRGEQWFTLATFKPALKTVAVLVGKRLHRRYPSRTFRLYS